MKFHPGQRALFAHGRRGKARRMIAAAATVLLLCGLALALPSVARGDAVAPACTGNATVCENQLPGTPESVWDVDGSGDKDIQGFATQISVNVGQSVQFKIDTTASAYRIEIYRLGYYQGNGARKQADVTPSATLPQVQPACATDATTEIYDCGTWGVSASWAVPSTAVSGVYIARLIRTDNGDSSHIPFIVRNDASHSDVVFQTSDPTWEAYNTYGQSDFYQGLANGRAYKVSYNRPITTRGDNSGRDFLFSNEYPMIRYLEQNGYDVSYISGLDTDIRGNLLTNHKVFTSVGHDEYWSAGQRSSVEAARDAGVSLAFFSGNEVYWKTRWEPSEDGTSTANRTLVCYKDTWANQQIDPLGPTSTWRDPRWGGNGKGPENALTGTLYMSNSDDLPITVSAREGTLRLWRNTSLTNQASGTSTALAPHTIGYESDEDLDNGFRPAGLIDLSTTVGSTPQYLQDFGSTVAPGTTTHHLTLYKAPSGALVFGAGTIQWAWGVDADHDGTPGLADVRMRQATMNILADMGASATTVASDLVPATASSDTVAPTAVITSPAAGTQIPQGAQVTVTGTATDAGGGVVAGIEVSVDGGSTWDPAVGTSSFTYSGILSGSGAQAIQVRATDDSGNIQQPATNLAVTSGCPCSMFGAVVPGTPAVSDTSSVTLGTKFTSSADGFITGLRFYKGAGNNGPHVGTLYTSAGTALATVTFANETATGWQSANFASTVPISAGSVYVAAYSAPQGHYAGDNNYFSSRAHSSGTLTALGGPSNAANGVYASGSTFPTQSYQSTNYYVDAVYSPTDNTPLTAGSTTPLDGSSSVPGSVVPTAKFSRAVTASTIAMTLTDPTNALVAGATSYDPTSRVVSLNPTTPLTPGVTYTARLNASSPDVGTMAAPVVWSFTVAKAPAAPGVCPCTVFDDTDAPTAGPDSGNSVELGAAFTADRSGTITGVRFYKDPANTGAHPVSLWTAGGSRLAQATAATETTSGWQEGDFSTPVAITAGTVYVVSYRAPTGHYSYTPGGLGSAINRSPLHLPAGAGRYTYGSGAPSTSVNTNYFVDPVFSPAPDAPPQVVSMDPGDNATSVPVGGSITATFNAPVQASATTVTVTDPSGNPVAGTVATESLGGAVTFVPGTPLLASTRYTVTVSGAVSAGGTPMSAPYTSHFTTSGVASCPCTLFASSASPQVSDSGDAGAVTVGLRFSVAVDGSVTGVRYYADAANTGAHTGTLYSSGGSSLAKVTFPPIQAPGWQYATFDTPVAVTAGSVYVAAVFMPVGHYSVSPAFFGAPFVNAPLTGQQGLYTYGSDALPTSSYNNGNYFVDAVFAVGATTTPPPTVSESDAVRRHHRRGDHDQRVGGLQPGDRCHDAPVHAHRSRRLRGAGHRLLRPGNPDRHVRPDVAAGQRFHLHGTVVRRGLHRNGDDGARVLVVHDGAGARADRLQPEPGGRRRRCVDGRRGQRCVQRSDRPVHPDFHAQQPGRLGGRRDRFLRPRQPDRDFQADGGAGREHHLLGGAVGEEHLRRGHGGPGHLDVLHGRAGHPGADGHRGDPGQRGDRGADELGGDRNVQRGHEHLDGVLHRCTRRRWECRRFGHLRQRREGRDVQAVGGLGLLHHLFGFADRNQQCGRTDDRTDDLVLHHRRRAQSDRIGAVAGAWRDRCRGDDVGRWNVQHSDRLDDAGLLGDRSDVVRGRRDGDLLRHHPGGHVQTHVGAGSGIDLHGVPGSADLGRRSDGEPGDVVVHDGPTACSDGDRSVAGGGSHRCCGHGVGDRHVQPRCRSQLAGVLGVGCGRRGGGRSRQPGQREQGGDVQALVRAGLRIDLQRLADRQEYSGRGDGCPGDVVVLDRSTAGTGGVRPVAGLRSIVRVPDGVRFGQVLGPGDALVDRDDDHECAGCGRRLGRLQRCDERRDLHPPGSTERRDAVHRVVERDRYRGRRDGGTGEVVVHHRFLTAGNSHHCGRPAA